MNKLPEVTIDDLIDPSDDMKGKMVLLNGFLGRVPYTANNFIAPEHIPIYDENGKELEFQYDHERVRHTDLGKMNLDLSANHMQEVHATVSICDKSGEYKIHEIKIHTHSRSNPTNQDSHHTYRLG